LNQHKMTIDNFECLKVRITQNKQGTYLVLNIHNDDLPDRIMRSWVGTRYYCVLIEADMIDEEAVIEFPKTEGEKIISRAGILARNKNFQKYIGAENESDSAEYIRQYCKIQSRSELKDNDEAKEQFEKITKRFNRWLVRNEDV